MKLSDRLRDLTRPTGEEDLLSVRYPTPRLAIDPKVGLWVAITCVVGVSGFALLRDAPSTTHEFAPAASLTPPTSTVAVVSVVGAVAAPGLVTVAAEARVDDALKMAGPLPEADVATINLAEKVVDGKQIYVPVVGEAPAPGAVTAGKVSLNSATVADLEQLDGVGQKTAEAIIKHRESLGGFSAVEQLREVKGIGPAKYAAIAPDVTL